MTAIEQAIKEAVEKGRYVDHAYCNAFDKYESYSPFFYSTIFLDPLFWQALGKAREWANVTCDGCGSTEKEPKDFCWCTDPDTSPNKPPDFIPTWKRYWHRFIDALASGESAENFFSKL